ncbi:MAG: sulfurtransferase [Oxalobacteraceae bacterium]|nr:sulfurtransferase [Oxalobacteraceae bacterium]
MLSFPNRAVLMSLILPLTVWVMPPFAQAVDSARVPVQKQTKAGLYVDAREAYELKRELGEKALFVDVRTRAEISYLGMPSVADAHIPAFEHPPNAAWDDKSGRFKMEPNADFEPALARRLAARQLGKSDVVILICRSGDRTSRAANFLTEQGYSKVYSVIDGFEGDAVAEGPQTGQRVLNGWKNAGLPWTYKLDKNKMYLPGY